MHIFVHFCNIENYETVDFAGFLIFNDKNKVQKKNKNFFGLLGLQKFFFSYLIEIFHAF